MIVPLPDISSLNKMFVSQPPAKEVAVWFPANPGLDDTCFPHRRNIVRNKSGVTTGDVIEAARKTPGMADLIPRGIDVVLKGGFLANAEARRLVEESGELTTENDPTRGQIVFGGHDFVSCELLDQEGGFVFT